MPPGWLIAHLYWQRPALTDLLSPYGNVAAKVFVAQNVEDLELGEVMEPVLAPILANSVVAAIAGFAQVAGLVAQSCGVDRQKLFSLSVITRAGVGHRFHVVKPNFG